jgi:hypothetical protein
VRHNYLTQTTVEEIHCDGTRSQIKKNKAIHNKHRDPEAGGTDPQRENKQDSILTCPGSGPLQDTFTQDSGGVTTEVTETTLCEKV